MDKELPEGWVSVKLKDISDIRMGQSPPGDSYNQEGEGILFLQGKTEFGDISPVSVDKYTTAPTKYAYPGSILISVRAPVGDVNIADREYCIGRGLAAILSESENNRYLFYYLKSIKELLESKGTGSTFKAINKETIESIVIPLPPLKTQRQIVAILEKAETIRRLREESDVLTQRLLQSVFLKMFGDPVTNPMGWEKTRIDQFGAILTGNTPPRDDKDNYGEYIDWIKSDNLNTPYTYVTQSEEKLSKKGMSIGRIAPKNSILVTCIAGSPSCIGNAAITDRAVAFNQQINAIIPFKSVSPMFLYYLIIFSKKGIQTFSTNSMKGMISKNIFASIPLIHPPEQKQRTFEKIASKIESSYQLQMHTKIREESLYNTLMAKAFSGELVA